MKNANGKHSVVVQCVSLFHSKCHGELDLDFFLVTFSEFFFYLALCFVSRFLPFCFKYWSSYLALFVSHRFLLQPQTGVYHALHLLIVDFKQ